MTISEFIEVITNAECCISLANEEIIVVAQDYYKIIGAVNIKHTCCHSIDEYINNLNDKKKEIIYTAIIKLSATPLNER